MGRQVIVNNILFQVILVYFVILFVFNFFLLVIFFVLDVKKVKIEKVVIKIFFKEGVLGGFKDKIFNFFSIQKDFKISVIYKFFFIFFNKVKNQQFVYWVIYNFFYN